MTRERFAPMGGIDRDGIPLVTGSGDRVVAKRPVTKTPGTAPRSVESGRCTVIYLPTERAHLSHARPAGNDPHQMADPAPSPSTEQATDRRSGRTRPYVEALIGWLLIFGTAYLALLLIGN
ncbi:hypothetical protein [Rhodospirillaceae bacterium SYSU D60014]|uniref:hypothetical protein n=1 Tax=Virgifigura deserti TaxID=2268457 RepID=UPI0013C3F0C3